MSFSVYQEYKDFAPLNLTINSYRQLENDLPSKKDGWKFPAQRVYEVSVPLLMLLCQPVSKYISIGMGGLRLVTHLVGCAQARQKQEVWKLASETSQVVLAGISFASFFYHVPMGAYVTTAADILKNLNAMISHYRAQKLDLMKDDLVQLVGSSFYMAVMLTCSANILLASIVIQGTINLYQASKNWKGGKAPEAVVQFVVASVRFYEAKQQWGLNQRYNAFLATVKAEKEQIQNIRKQLQEQAAEKKLQEEKSTLLSPEQSLDKTDRPKINHPTETHKREISQAELISDPVFKRLAQKVDACKQVEHLRNSPLQNLEGKIKENQLVMEGAPGEYFKGGANFHSYGKGGVVKGTNLHFQNKTVDEEEATVLDFKVNHVFREKIEPLISELREMSNHPHINEMLALTGSEIKGIHVDENLIGDAANLRLHEITLKGLGTLYVGADRNCAGFYDQIIVKVEKSPEIEKFHQILSFLDLQDALKPCSADDIERCKIGLLFRSFCPREATLLERTEEFFALSIEKLKDLVIQKAPKMGEIFSEFLSKMEPYEIFPGRIRYRISGLAQKCHEAGGRALIHAIGGEGHWEGDNEKDFNHLISIMNMGLFSNETRRIWGIREGGGPSNDDLWKDWDSDEYWEAKVDSVFTRLVTKENCRVSIPLENYTFIGKARCGIIISLDSLETGTYQYHSQEEAAGFRKLYAPYLNRESILEFIQEELIQFNGDNEVMLKERVLPSWFTAIVFTDQELKNRFVDYLRRMGRIKIDETGEEKLDGHPLERFIRYATNVSEELVSR